MRSIFTFVAVALLTLSADAALLSEESNHNGYDPNAELVFHTAAPGMLVMPRIDMDQMVMAYDVTPMPREGQAVIRWGKLDENGEGEGLWTKWREFDDVITFSTPGIYVIETHAESIGKDNSSTLKATFKVNYLGMTYAPGITLTPNGERGYDVTMTSLYGDDIYYRIKFFEDGIWNKWHLYKEAIPFTSGGNYVLDAHCEGDLLSLYIEVPNVDFARRGDVNHNGVIDVEDLTALINMLMNEELIIGTGDVNRDGFVTIQDVASLINLLLKSGKGE